MENLSETPNTPGVSDVNRSDFYKDINNHNESMKAHLQKILQVIYTSRVEAAELEVKTAAQQHGTKLWKDLVEDMQENTDNDKNEPPTT